MGTIRAPRTLPRGLEPLYDLALDLRWTWSREADDLWHTLDARRWAASANPWMLLQDVEEERLARLAADPVARRELARLDERRREYLAGRGWFGEAHPQSALRGVAYFSMEFGLGESLPLYAGGLGVLAGDHLKAASDLGVPIVGVGLLYQEGYFRQQIDASGWQHEIYPYNAPGELPLEPVLAPDDRRLRVTLEFPGRLLHVRAWRAQVGRVILLLLDTNDPENAPLDRAITTKLYTGDPSVQFLQEVVLGIGGWRLLEELGLPIDVCHLNEGHAAFAVLERARSLGMRTGLPFHEALWATRAGNVFTTHTAVPAAFDRFGPDFVAEKLPYLRIYVDRLGVTLGELLALGRAHPDDPSDPFNLAFLAMRGCIAVNAVSALHGSVSRELFRELYPRWPLSEVPVGHVTNGVHVPTWISPAADRLWQGHSGPDDSSGEGAELRAAIDALPDAALWAARNESRRQLVEAARRRLARQRGFRGAEREDIERAQRALDPGALTVGFARRFAPYKRPTLLLSDPARLARLLTDSARPVQLVVAGKAHPADVHGKELLRAWVRFAREPAMRDHVVFLEDYDLSLAEELVRGVDVWLNTPRAPWEACGTSGMKVLASGGLNLSSLDGWWAEAFSPAAGWAIDAAGVQTEFERDAVEAQQLYQLLEQEIVPAFYERDGRGIPARWLALVRASVAELAPRFSADRMVREYVERFYLPASDLLARRLDDDARLARELAEWQRSVACGWRALAFGTLEAKHDGIGLTFTVEVHLGTLRPDMVRVELYAEPAAPGDARACIEMSPLSGDSSEVATYRAFVPTSRPASDFTPRIVPHHACVRSPAEASQILWYR